MAGSYETFREDLPDFIRGRLEFERASELLKAAEHDEVLRAAIEQERSLERWLDYYEAPELSDGFEGRFWRKFQEERVVAGRSSLWLVRLIGPIAAAVLIAVGVIVFINNEEDPQTPVVKTAEVLETEDPSMEVTWGESEFDYIAGAPNAVEDVVRGEKLDATALATMKTLDNAAFLALDDLDRPEDLAVVDDLELLTELAEDK
jgi:hypothetical protein